MTDPRVLVISNNCFSNSNSNGRTLGNFFFNWDKGCLAQFYIQAELPDALVCEQYYRVTDYELLKAIFKFSLCGRALKQEEVFQNKPTRTDLGLEKRIHTSGFKRKPLMRVLRELIWRSKSWRTEELSNWIESFDPEIILFQAGDCAFLCEIAVGFSREFKIPLIVYNSEDYYLKELTSNSPMYRLQRKMLKNSFEKLMKQTAHTVYLCDLLKESFDHVFYKPGTAILTSSCLEPSDKTKSSGTPVIAYLGNVGVERWKSIVEVGRALQKIDSNYFVEVYAQSPERQAMKAFTAENGIHFNGAVPYDRVIELMQQSELLLHAESFSEFIKKDLKHAFSTKIADSLACGTCLLAYGPEEIASIRYLKENAAACVITDRDKLEQSLRELLTDESLRQAYVINAQKLAKERHDAEVNARIFRRILCDAAMESRLEKLDPDEAENNGMKILQVNVVYKRGSTGKIVEDLHAMLQSRGVNSVVCYGRGQKEKEAGVYKVSTELGAKIHALYARLSGVQYSASYFATNKLIRIIKRENPDVVHLHCLNGYFVNIYRLLNYLSRSNTKTVVTLHAEFMYTGNCGSSFDCTKWMTGCGNCGQRWEAVSSLLWDRTNDCWRRMQKAFSGFSDNLVVACVSGWLLNRAKQAPILKGKQLSLVQNGVDTKHVFYKRNKDELKRQLGLTDEKLLFHATAYFDDDEDSCKGGYYILELAKRLKEENLKIIVASMYSKKMDLPTNIISVGRIKDQNQLAEYYSMADLTVITSRSETFSMPCAESLSCGTPVIGFLAGGPETIALPEFSRFVPYGDMDALESCTREWMHCKAEITDELSGIASEHYSREKMFDSYMELYQSGGDERMGRIPRNISS